MNIWISLGTEFEFKLTILIFGEKGYFRWKTGKSLLQVVPWSLITILNNGILMPLFPLIAETITSFFILLKDGNFSAAHSVKCTH